MQYKQEEEEKTVDFCYGESDVDDPAVELVDCETEQHDCDGGFEGHVGEDVDWFTCPPPFDTDWDLGWGEDICGMLTCAVEDTCCCEGAEEDEENLGYRVSI